MYEAMYSVPVPKNEPVMSYAPGSPERAALKKQIAQMRSNEIEIPLIIGGKEIRTGDLADCRCPHDHRHLLGRYHRATSRETDMAIKAALKAKAEWERFHWKDRVAILLKAAELLAGPYRFVANAATMLGQSKNVFQAEIDSACELIDFWRFNPYYAWKIYQDQPDSAAGILNYVEQRPLEGFVFAITPFNFSSIAGNLPTAPALMGNTVVWKPASSAVYSAYYLMKILMEAGMPPGVINFVPGLGANVGPSVLAHPDLAGVHFTGSTAVFQNIWKTIGSSINRYRSYPRIVGETGGKNFVFVHASADIEALVAALLRGAFEYQGQKCSAASRVYIPDSLWPKVKTVLLSQLETIKMGPVEDFRNFVNAVIDRSAYNSIKKYIDGAKADSQQKIIAGGKCSDRDGYFISPTVILTSDPKSKTMVEEIFGPVMTVYIYPEKKYEETLQLCDQTSIYGLTGSVFAQDRDAIVKASRILRHSAGNFYINDKPTGAVVGQQPFGGSRASGTNDKAGSMLNLLRWISTRAVKENFNPPRDYRYPFLEAQ